jgi:hypothetical protein
MADSSDFCCNIHAMTAEQRLRYQALRGRLEASVTGIEEREDGYVLQLRPAGLSAGELVEWVEYERTCCPFLNLTIALAAEGKPPTLQVTGGAGVKAFLRAEFSALHLP